jgi:hypothetical protein
MLIIRRPPRLARWAPRSSPSWFGPTDHTPTHAPVRSNRPIQPSLFIGRRAPPARAPCTVAAIRHAATVVPRVTAARVRRPLHASAPPSSASPLFDRVPPPPPDSTTNHQPHPLATDTERRRTFIITGPSTWVTQSMCCAPQIPRGSNLSAAFIPRSTEPRPSVVMPHTPPWVPRSIERLDLCLRGQRRPWEGRRHRTRNPEGWIYAALTTSEVNVTTGRAAF